MLRVGLTGGIASGKSTVSARLAELGAVVVDADRVAREVVEPGTPGLAAIAARFGSRVLAEDGALDRPALGAVVFADPEARRDLEAITHPRILARSQELVAAAPPDAVVVHDLPLLVELGREADYALTVVVAAPEEERVRRMVELRGMTPEDARSRVVAQAADEQRAAAADVLLHNEGTVQELLDAVDRLWADRLVPFEENLRLRRPVRRPETLAVVEHDPAWAGQAGRLLARVLAALGDSVLRADHVGSTSVPGLPAKDVVDLQVVVPDLAVLDEPQARTALEQVGFLVPDRLWHDHDHRRTSEPARTTRCGQHEAVWPKRILAVGDPARVVHCHVRPVDSPAWRWSLLLRDWLRAEADARADYLRLKQELVARGLSTTDYAEAKEPWFVGALARARAWADAQGWSPNGARVGP